MSLIKNPFLNVNSDIKFEQLTQIYILCLNNEQTEMNNNIYNEYIDEVEYMDYKNRLSLIKASKYVLMKQEFDKNKNKIVFVNSEILESYNKEGYKFKDIETVLFIPHIWKKDVLKFTSISKSYSLDDIVKIKLIKDYIDNTVPVITMYSSIKSYKYWTIKSNYNITFNNDFVKRKFKLKNNTKLEGDIKSILDNMEIADTNNYTFMNELETNNKLSTVYKISNRYEMVTSEIVNELFGNTKSTREIYTMFNTLLVSKNYCHFVLNNIFVLDKMQFVFLKYKPLYKYLIGYAWLMFYIEETIVKTRTTVNSRYVFDINTAAKLPVFPYNSTNPHDNPYLTLLVSNMKVDHNNNFVGQIFDESKCGINTLDMFRMNFNIFVTGNDKYDLFENMDWSNIAISGSVMPACIPKYNPLMKLFTDTNRYYNEYYANSDIDVMCNLVNVFEFINKVYTITNNLQINLKKLYNDDNIIIEPVKTIVLMVSESYIKDNIANIANTGYNFKYIVDNISTLEIKELFYVKYIDYKIKNNIVNRNNGFKDDKYNVIYEPCNISAMSIIITKNEIIPDGINNGIYIADGNKYIKLNEILKFKIRSTFMQHPLEIFQIQYPDFFSCVSRFHLPCVRSYYDGNNVFMLPSAITAYLTFQNIDYKYFTGSKDPINIIYKYRIRGFGTFLNNNEKKTVIEYTTKIPKWTKLMTFNNQLTIFGHLNINHNLFKPRRYCPSEYYTCKPVMDSYVYLADQESNNIITYSNFPYQSINENGFVEKLKLWTIDMAYDLF